MFLWLSFCFILPEWCSSSLLNACSNVSWTVATLPLNWAQMLFASLDALRPSINCETYFSFQLASTLRFFHGAPRKDYLSHSKNNRTVEALVRSVNSSEYAASSICFRARLVSSVWMSATSRCCKHLCNVPTTLSQGRRHFVLDFDISSLSLHH